MEDVKQKSWFGRNWLWVLPVSGCLTIIVLLVLGAGALFFGVNKVLTSSEPYQVALDRAFENTEVKQLLGEPLETTGIMNGNISTSNRGGEVDLSIPIKGPKGEANIVISGDKIDGEWVYEELYVIIKESKERINLLDKTLEGI